MRSFGLEQLDREHPCFSWEAHWEGGKPDRVLPMSPAAGGLPLLQSCPGREPSAGGGQKGIGKNKLNKPVYF